MRLLRSDGSELWLAYCMNVHPGGTLESTLDAIHSTVLPLRRRLGARGPFGIGLRFDAVTAHRLASQDAALDGLADLLGEHELVPFTGNAFVAGAFHGRRVKEQVYAPTWESEERLAYTLAFAQVLARLPGPHRRVSLSTSPLSWRAWGEGRDVDAACAAQLVRAARGLVELELETGRSVRLGLEPEPGCSIQAVEEAIAFFGGPLAQALDGDEGAAGHLGLCYDVCHQAVVHESVAEGLDALRRAGVAVAKLQASCALEVPDPGHEASRVALAAFDEPVYLHQVGARDAAGRLHVATDLLEALAGGEDWPAHGPWRVHFHVPVFRGAAVPPLATTQPFLEEALAEVARTGVTDHVEIETYTWEVLPEAERLAGSGFDLVDALAREYEYVLSVLAAHGVRWETA